MESATNCVAEYLFNSYVHGDDDAKHAVCVLVGDTRDHRLLRLLAEKAIAHGEKLSFFTKLLVAVCSNHASPPDAIRLVWENLPGRHFFTEKFAGNNNTPLDVLTEIVDLVKERLEQTNPKDMLGVEAIVQRLIRNAKLSDAMYRDLTMLCVQKGLLVFEIANSWRTPPDVLEVICADEARAISMSPEVMANPSMPRHVMERLILTGHPKVLMGIAMNPCAPGDILELVYGRVLRGHYSDYDRIGVFVELAKNHACPEEVLFFLSFEDDPIGRYARETLTVVHSYAAVV